MLGRGPRRKSDHFDSQSGPPPVPALILGFPNHHPMLHHHAQINVMYIVSNRQAISITKNINVFNGLWLMHLHEHLKTL